MACQLGIDFYNMYHSDYPCIIVTSCFGESELTATVTRTKVNWRLPGKLTETKVYYLGGGSAIFPPFSSLANFWTPYM